jgi:hypothetical protein
MFCAPGLIFIVTEGVVYHHLVWRSRSRFHRNRARRVLFSCFVFSNSFLAVPRASGPVFMFCSLGRNFGGKKGVGFRFDVLRSRTYFRRNRGRRVPFSCFAFPDSFSVVLRASGTFSCFALLDTFLAVPRALGPAFKFCAPRPVFSGSVVPV